MTHLSLAALDSATKYPSIDTYHVLDPKDGKLTDEVRSFPPDTEVVLTEKVDGTNGRIVLLPDGDYLIGSRDSLIYARGDRIVNPAMGLVDALLPLARHLATRYEAVNVVSDSEVTVLFLEVFGSKIGSSAKQYTASGSGLVGYRMFDQATVPIEVLLWPREQIASWREHGGQQWLAESDLRIVAEAYEYEVELTPRLASVRSQRLPSTLQGTRDWLAEALPTTNVALDDQAGGRPEGVVLRTTDRSMIVKARIQDYDRALRGGKR